MFVSLKIVLSLVLVTFVHADVSNSATNENKSEVVDLTDQNFDTEIANFETALVMFYAPWCGHCKAMKPKFNKAAKILLKNDPPVTLARVDCTADGKKICGKFSIRGYPTLNIFKNGELLSEYDGPDDSGAEIAEFMKGQAGPASVELELVADYEKLMAEDETCVIGFFDEKDSTLSQTFAKVANKLRETVSFGHTKNPAVLKKAGQKKDTLVLYRPKELANTFEPDSVVYSGSLDDKKVMVNFIKKEYHGLVGIRTEGNSDDFQEPVVILYSNIDFSDSKKSKEWRNRVLKVANEFKGQITFAVSSPAEFLEELGEVYGVEPSSVSPGKYVIIARDVKGQKFVEKGQGELSSDSLSKFVKKFNGGQLEPFIMSQPIPKTNDGPVLVAVAKNFDKIVIDNDKDTLIEFYAPWCGYCKQLAPIYDQLGEKMKNEDVAIVKMDATANDVRPDFDVEGFPSLYWLPKNKKDKPIPYEADTELDDLIEFIAKHATNELKNYDRKGKSKPVETVQKIEL